MNKPLHIDLIKTLKANPGFLLVYVNKVPAYLHGKYTLLDNNNIMQEEYEVRIYFDSEKYPYSFPVLQEISNKIPRCIDRHMNKDGFTCVEIAQRIAIITSKGITIKQFVDFYVHKFFCWQLVYDLESKKDLKEWPHFQDGTMKFYSEIFNTGSIDCILDTLKFYILNQDFEMNLRTFRWFMELKSIGEKQILIDINELLSIKRGLNKCIIPNYVKLFFNQFRDSYLQKFLKIDIG